MLRQAQAQEQELKCCKPALVVLPNLTHLPAAKLTARAATRATPVVPCIPEPEQLPCQGALPTLRVLRSGEGEGEAGKERDAERQRGGLGDRETLSSLAPLSPTV